MTDYDFYFIGRPGAWCNALAWDLSCYPCPNLALCARRLHDSNHSGWWLLGCGVRDYPRHRYFHLNDHLASILGSATATFRLNVTSVYSKYGLCGEYAVVGLLLFALHRLLSCACRQKAEGQRFDKPEDWPYFPRACGRPDRRQVPRPVAGRRATTAGRQKFPAACRGQAQYGVGDTGRAAGGTEAAAGTARLLRLLS